jgi:hypothetical protein
VTALVTALRDGKETELRAFLGPEGDCIIDSGDRYADRKLHERFIALDANSGPSPRQSLGFFARSMRIKSSWGPTALVPCASPSRLGC